MNSRRYTGVDSSGPTTTTTYQQHQQPTYQNVPSTSHPSWGGLEPGYDRARDRSAADRPAYPAARESSQSTHRTEATVASSTSYASSSATATPVATHAQAHLQTQTQLATPTQNTYTIQNQSRSQMHSSTTRDAQYTPKEPWNLPTQSNQPQYSSQGQQQQQYYGDPPPTATMPYTSSSSRNPGQSSQPQPQAYTPSSRTAGPSSQQQGYPSGMVSVSPNVNPNTNPSPPSRNDYARYNSAAGYGNGQGNGYPESRDRDRNGERERDRDRDRGRDRENERERNLEREREREERERERAAQQEQSAQQRERERERARVLLEQEQQERERALQQERERDRFAQQERERDPRERDRGQRTATYTAVAPTSAATPYASSSATPYASTSSRAPGLQTTSQRYEASQYGNGNGDGNGNGASNGYRSTTATAGPTSSRTPAPGPAPSPSQRPNYQYPNGASNALPPAVGDPSPPSRYGATNQTYPTSHTPVSSQRPDFQPPSRDRDRDPRDRERYPNSRDAPDHREILTDTRETRDPRHADRETREERQRARDEHVRKKRAQERAKEEEQLQLDMEKAKASRREAARVQQARQVQPAERPAERSGRTGTADRNGYGVSGQQTQDAYGRTVMSHQPVSAVPPRYETAAREAPSYRPQTVQHSSVSQPPDARPGTTQPYAGQRENRQEVRQEAPEDFPPQRATRESSKPPGYRTQRRGVEAYTSGSDTDQTGKRDRERGYSRDVRAPTSAAPPPSTSTSRYPPMSYDNQGYAPGTQDPSGSRQASSRYAGRDRERDDGGVYSTEERERERGRRISESAQNRSQLHPTRNPSHLGSRTADSSVQAGQERLQQILQTSTPAPTSAPYHQQSFAAPPTASAHGNGGYGSASTHPSPESRQPNSNRPSPNQGREPDMNNTPTAFKVIASPYASSYPYGTAPATMPSTIPPPASIPKVPSARDRDRDRDRGRDRDRDEDVHRTQAHVAGTSSGRVPDASLSAGGYTPGGPATGAQSSFKQQQQQSYNIRRVPVPADSPPDRAPLSTPATVTQSPYPPTPNHVHFAATPSSSSRAPQLSSQAMGTSTTSGYPPTSNTAQYQAQVSAQAGSSTPYGVKPSPPAAMPFYANALPSSTPLNGNTNNLPSAQSQIQPPSARHPTSSARPLSMAIPPASSGVRRPSHGEHGNRRTLLLDSDREQDSGTDRERATRTRDRDAAAAVRAGQMIAPSIGVQDAGHSRSTSGGGPMSSQITQNMMGRDGRREASDPVAQSSSNRVFPSQSQTKTSLAEDIHSKSRQALAVILGRPNAPSGPGPPPASSANSRTIPLTSMATGRPEALPSVRESRVFDVQSQMKVPTSIMPSMPPTLREAVPPSYPTQPQDPYAGRRSDERPPTERPTFTHRATASMDRSNPNTAILQPATTSLALKHANAPSAPKVKQSRSTFFPSLSSKGANDGAQQPSVLEKAAAAVISRMRTTSGGKSSGLLAMGRGQDAAASSSENVTKSSGQIGKFTPGLAPASLAGIHDGKNVSRFPVVEENQTPTPSTGQHTSRLHPTPTVAPMGIDQSATPRSLNVPQVAGNSHNSSPRGQSSRPSPQTGTVEPPSPGNLQARRSSRVIPPSPEMQTSLSGRQAGVSAATSTRTPNAPYPIANQPAPSGIPVDRPVANNDTIRPSFAAAFQAQASLSSPYVNPSNTVPSSQPPGPLLSSQIFNVAPPVSVPQPQSRHAPFQPPAQTTAASNISAARPLQGQDFPSARQVAATAPISAHPATTYNHGTSSREPSIRAPSPTAPSISSVVRPPSAPPPSSSQVSLGLHKKSSVFSRIFRPSKTSSKEPKVQNPLTRVVSDNTGTRKLTRQPTSTAPKPKGKSTAWTQAPQMAPLPRTASSNSTSGNTIKKPGTPTTPTKSYAAAARTGPPPSGPKATSPPVASQQANKSLPPSNPWAQPRPNVLAAGRTESSKSATTMNGLSASSTLTPPSSYPSARKAETDTETTPPAERVRRPSMPSTTRKSEPRKHIPTPPATLRIPANASQLADKKSPSKNAAMRFLTTSKRYMTVSTASIEALDGTHHLQTTPSTSTLSTAFAGPPSAFAQRDTAVATQSWRNNEEATVRARTTRPRPGITWDIDEDPPEAELENRTKMRSNSFRRKKASPS